MGMFRRILLGFGSDSCDGGEQARSGRPGSAIPLLKPVTS